MSTTTYIAAVRIERRIDGKTEITDAGKPIDLTDEEVLDLPTGAIKGVDLAKFDDDAAEEADRVAAEQAEADRLAAERVAAEQAEADRVAAEQAEADRVAAEQAEADRVAAEQAEADRIAAESSSNETTTKTTGRKAKTDGSDL